MAEDWNKSEAGRVYQKKYREQNRDEVNAKTKRWRDEYPDKAKESSRRNYLKNKDKIAEQGREYREKNRDEINARKRAARNRDPEKARFLDKASRERNSEYYSSYLKVYRDENRGILNSKQRKRYSMDSQYKTRLAIRNRLATAIRLQYSKKAYKTKELIGCSVAELMSHLESQFKPGMTWENHSHSGWHIDHKIPCAAFDLTDPEQQKKCFHYTNLQPLWAKENLSKSGKFDVGAISSLRKVKLTDERKAANVF